MTRAARFIAADTALYVRTRSLPESPAAVRAAVGLSHAGEHARVWLGAGALCWALDGRRRGRWAAGTAAVAIAHGACSAIKIAVRRPRPSVAEFPPLVSTLSQRSFPSSHAASTFAAASVVQTVAGSGILWPVAGAMAVSRVYLGVHYPADVAAGAAIGVAVARAARRLQTR